MRYLIALIVLTITIQNTCPFGYAAKTAFAAPHAHHCPLKEGRLSRTDGRNKMVKVLRNLNHPFVLVPSPVADTGGSFDTVREMSNITNTGFEDIFPDPPLRPPRS
jgi:hypothetical protein